MAAALKARVVRRVEREEIEARDRAHSRFAGWECNACPSCGQPLMFDELVVRCGRSPGHYTRVSLPSPSMGELWGLSGQPWARLYSMGHSIPTGWRDRVRRSAASRVER